MGPPPWARCHCSPGEPPPLATQSCLSCGRRAGRAGGPRQALGGSRTRSGDTAAGLGRASDARSALPLQGPESFSCPPPRVSASASCLTASSGASPRPRAPSGCGQSSQVCADWACQQAGWEAVLTCPLASALLPRRLGAQGRAGPAGEGMLPTSAALSSGGLRPWLLVGPIASQLQQVGRQEATGRGCLPDTLWASLLFSRLGQEPRRVTGTVGCGQALLSPCEVAVCGGLRTLWACGGQGRCACLSFSPSLLCLWW